MNLCIDRKLVGMETRVKNVVSSLETGFDDVRMVGINGMGDGGKTTLARAVFNHISTLFEGKSFVENVREVSKGSLYGLKELQKKILSDVLNDQSIVEKGISNLENMMKTMMRSRKVLVVLDDVDDVEQLEALAGEVTWFKPGSRIIIETN
ncbi:putative P-loop containing nucleoside triphosphate hydrolase [Helianthus debilis subsp. tardiflorus]